MSNPAHAPLLEFLDRCHRAVAQALKSMLRLRDLVGPTPWPAQSDEEGNVPPSQPRHYPKKVLEEGEKAVGAILDHAAPAFGIDAVTWAAFAAHVPPGMPVVACGREAGSWHQAVFHSCRALGELAEGAAASTWLDGSHGLLPVDERDVELILGFLDREWGSARERVMADAGDRGSPAPQARSPDEPHIKNGQLVIPPTPIKFSLVHRGLLEALLLKEGDLVSQADLSDAGWGRPDKKAATIRRAVMELQKRLTDAGWGSLASRIEPDRVDRIYGRVLRRP